MKERAFHSETRPLRVIRRIRKPDIFPESSLQYLDSRTKRALDIILGSLGLPVAFPIILLAAGVNKLVNPREPAFYKSKRVGENGGEISFIKLRSLKTVEEPETAFQNINPQRVNWFGRFLRRTGVDELPQTFMLLCGEISAVGPRPIGIWEMELAQSGLPNDVFEDWRGKYIAHKPGGTSLRAIFGNKDLSYYQRARLDQFYATHANLGLDLYIVFASVFALIRGKGIR